MSDPDPTESCSTTRRAALAAAAGTASFGVVGTAAAANSVEMYLFGTERYADNVENYHTSYEDHMDEVESTLQTEYWSQIEDGDDYQLEVTSFADDGFLVPESELGFHLSIRCGDANGWIHERLEDDENPEICHVLDWHQPSTTYYGTYYAPEYGDYTSEDGVENTSIARVDPQYDGYDDPDHADFFAGVHEAHASAHEILHQFGASHSHGVSLGGNTASTIVAPSTELEDIDCFPYREPRKATERISPCTRDVVRNKIDTRA